MKPNSKRERSWSAPGLRFVFTGAQGLAVARSRFERQTRSARTPPIPPHGRALKLRPWEEVEARASGLRSRFVSQASRSTDPHDKACEDNGHRVLPLGSNASEEVSKSISIDRD